MAYTSQKQAFLQRIRANARALDTAITEGNELVSYYFDRGYNDGGADKLTTAEIQSDATYADLDETKLAAYITAIQQAYNYRENAAVTQSDYAASLKKAAGL